MKRLALLMTVTIIVSIFVSSSLLASPLRIEKPFMSIRAFVSHWFMRFIDPFQGYVELPVDDNGSGGILGGDADDYANGRDNSEPDGDEKRSGRLNAGSAVIGPEEFKPIYRLYCSH